MERLNLSDRRSLQVSLAVVRELDRSPDRVLEKGLENIARWQRGSGRHAHLQEWEMIIRRGPAAVRTVLTGLDDRSQQLRSSSPFAGVLSEKSRLAAVARASAIPEHSL